MNSTITPSLLHSTAELLCSVYIMQDKLTAHIKNAKEVHTTRSISILFKQEIMSVHCIQGFLKKMYRLNPGSHTCSSETSCSLGRTIPHTATTFAERSPNTICPCVYCSSFSFCQNEESGLAKTRACSTFCSRDSSSSL